MTDMNDINKTHSQVIPTQNQSLNEKKDENRLHKNTSSSFKNTSFSKNKYKTDLMNMSNNLLKKPNAKRITSYCESLSNQNEHINKSRRNDFNNGPTLRNEKVDADKYYQLCEENQKLKQDQEKLNEKFKDLQTQLYQVGEKMIKERIHGDKKVIYLEDGCEIEMMNIKNENEKLKEQLRKTKTIIKGMQVKERYSQSNGMKNIYHVKDGKDGKEESQKTHNEYLKLIRELKSTLNDQDMEIKRLHSELYGPNKKIKGHEDYSTDIKEKNVKLNEVQIKNEQLQIQVDTHQKIVKHLQDNVNELRSNLREEQRRVNDLKDDNARLKAGCERLPEYVNLIEEYKKREVEFEGRINSLCESPFIKQAEERGNIYRKLQETEALLKEQGIDYRKLKETSLENERERLRIKNENEELKKEKDQYKEEAMRHKIANEEREKNTKTFQEQLNLLSQYGEVDSDFTKILSILKLKDDDNTWMKVEFFDRLGEKNLKDPQFLLKEIEKLIQEKGELGRQLEISKNVQILQQKLIEDMKKEREELEKIMNYQINELKVKCEQYAKRNDFERVQNKGKQEKIRKIKEIDDKSYFEDVTEFTRDDNESVLGINENAIDIFIGEASFEPSISTELGIKTSDILSFITVDFYMHDIQSSNISSGSRPIYNLQLRFVVQEDDHFIKYLESNDGIKLEIFYIKDNLHSLLGHGIIPISQLLEYEGEMDGGRKIINNVCSIYYKDKNSLLIGNIHYKLKLKQSLCNTLQWYKDKKQILDEISPVQKVIDYKAKSNIEYIHGLNKGKIMQITIMITKLNGLIVSGAPREIKPYIWYQFYKSEEHFSKIYLGNNPVIEDVNILQSIYDSSFDDYIQNGDLSFMILDDFRPIEVKTSTINKNEMQVDLVDDPDLDDFIGICTIKLKDLIIKDKIQGSFPITNKQGKKSGEISMIIFWEELKIDGKKKNTVNPKRNEWEEGLIIELGEKLKGKKLNVDSGFEYFNLDNEVKISASNFRNVLMTQLKYNNKDEIDGIIEILFKDSLFLSKLTFNKYFLPLLDTNYSSNISNIITEKKDEKIVFVNAQHEKIEKKKVESVLIEEKANIINIISDKITKQNQTDEDNISISNINTKQLLRTTTKEVENDKRNLSLLEFKVNSDRPTKEILILMSEYCKRTNKVSIADIFKLFDKDGNSFILKKEVLNGFIGINIPLSKQELDKIWNEMTNGHMNQEKVVLSEFKRFFEGYDVIKRR